MATEAVQELVARIVKTYGDRPWGPRNDGGVADCIPDPTSGLMYVAGHWDFVTGPNSFTDTLPIGKIIAVDLDSGLTINTWDAETNSERGLDALAVIPGVAIIIGGAFTQSGGQNLNGLARFNLLSASTLTAPQPDLDVLLVVADPASLQAGETEIKDRLETRGATVTVADDNTVTGADADAVDVVLVSQGVSSSAVNTKLNNTTTGVVVWKPSLYDDLGLTTAPAGTTASQTQVDIVDPAHPIADGLTGAVTVYDSSKKTTFGTPAATAAVVADTAGASTTPVIFTYDEGDTLANSTTAAGRRVGFYFDTNAPTVTSSDGWVLFDNTVTWTANSPPPITQRSTVSLGGVSVATVSEGEVTWLVTDNLGSPTVTYRADGKTPASVALYYPYGQPRTAQIDGTGTGFTGQISDLESGTGLAFYNARYYDPALGRFTQPDTIIPNPNNGQDYNRYSYVRNNPLRYTDPSGNICFERNGEQVCSDGGDDPSEAQSPAEESASFGEYLANVEEAYRVWYTRTLNATALGTATSDPRLDPSRFDGAEPGLEPGATAGHLAALTYRSSCQRVNGCGLDLGFTAGGVADGANNVGDAAFVVEAFAVGATLAGCAICAPVAAAAAVVGTGASGVELVAGAVDGDLSHVVNGGVGLVAFGVTRVAGRPVAGADEALEAFSRGVIQVQTTILEYFTGCVTTGCFPVGPSLPTLSGPPLPGRTGP